MPDVPVEPVNSGRYPADMESRVAVLEQIARETTASLGRIERGMDAQRQDLHALQERFEYGVDAQRKELLVFQERFERRLDMHAAEQRAEFRWLLGVMLAGLTTLLGAFGAMLGVMAHGFHWL